MSQLPTNGQPISIRTQLTEAEWRVFQNTCGLICSTREGTLQKISLPARFVKLATESSSLLARFSNGECWYVPLFLLDPDPFDPHQAIINKIKYLDNRYVTRHQQKPVPQVSTDW